MSEQERSPRRVRRFLSAVAKGPADGTSRPGDSQLRQSAPWLLVALLCLLCLLASTGCVDVKADASNLFGNPDDASSAKSRSVADTRTAAQVKKENDQLRQEIAGLETNHQNWGAALKQRENELRALKRQREDLKKQVAHYKQAWDMR